MAILPTIAPTSVRVSQSGLPVSRAIVVAKASLCSVNNSANLTAMAIRASIGVFDHASKAARADITASPTCAGVAVFPCQTTSFLAGFFEKISWPKPAVH